MRQIVGVPGRDESHIGKESGRILGAVRMSLPSWRRWALPTVPVSLSRALVATGAAALSGIVLAAGVGQARADGDLTGWFFAAALVIGGFGLLVIVALWLEERLAALADAVEGEGALYRFLCDHAADGITRHRGDGRILYASPAAARLFLQAPGALEGQTPASLVEPEDRVSVQLAFLQASYRHEDAAVECRLRAPGGTPLWVEMRMRPVWVVQRGERGQKRRVREIVAITRDITARKAAELALADAREAAEASSAAKTRFLSGVTHELRTPLNAVLGFSEMIARETFGPAHPRYVEYAALIHESGQHLLSLVNDVLDLAKMEAGKQTLRREPVDLGKAAATALDIVTLQAQKARITLALDIEPGLPQADADPRAIRQIVLNLVANALKFTPAGGRVTVALAREGAAIRLTVTDTGIGIPAAALARLGRAFEQVEEAQGGKVGTGLGLAIVKALTALHGGFMDIRSREGEGTQVAIYIPASAQIPAPEVLPAARRQPARWRGAA